MAKVVPVERPSSGEFGGNQRLRRHSESLSRLDLPSDNHKNVFFENVSINRFFSPKASREETEEGGKVLFGQILVSEMEQEMPERAQQQDPDQIVQELEICSPDEYSNQIWMKTGQELRRYADEFKKSKERQKVKKKAQEFGRTSITKEQFRDLLHGLLSDAITPDRIIVLFFFCADVAIATLKEGGQSSTELCLQYIAWSLEFIKEQIVTWVQDKGGWGAVFNSSLQYVGKAVVAAGVIAVLYFGVKKFINRG